MPALDEAEVRHLCGPASYARATALQAAGHVVRLRMNNLALTLSADVRGTWRRIDHVQVEADKSQFVATCSCGIPGLCGHAGALLLQWLRAPDSFERLSEAPSTDSSSLLSAQPEPPRAELLHALQPLPLERLRQIGRARSVRLTARSKADVAAQLAAGLAEPANIDAALTELRPAELLALRVTCLVADGTATFTAIQAGFERSGGSGEVPLEHVLELGLVVGDDRDVQSSFSFKVPRLVAARLPVWSELIRMAKAVAPEVPGFKRHRSWHARAARHPQTMHSEMARLGDHSPQATRREQARCRLAGELILRMHARYRWVRWSIAVAKCRWSLLSSSGTKISRNWRRRRVNRQRQSTLACTCSWHSGWSSADDA